MKRFLLMSVLVVAILVVGGAFYLRHYLRSPQVASQVATRIESLYGGPVHIESADVGLGGSSVSGFELFEPGADPATSTPWLKVGSLQTDLSLWDILRGAAMPRQVTVTGAHVVLRFDADGRLATQFPTQPGKAGELSKLDELPEVTLENSEIVFQKAGQPELVAHHVNARLVHDEGDKLTLSGTADSAELGKLELSGSLNPATHLAAGTLKTAGSVQVTQPLLNRLPFIPAVTWQEIRIDQGETPAELALSYDLSGGALHYRLTLAPHHTTLEVPLLDLAAQDAHAELVVDDYLVQLRKASGKAYGGDVQLDADLDFRAAESKLTFPKIGLSNLNVSQLPASWDVPDTVRKLFAKGKLSGNVSVEVTLGNSPISPAGVDALIGIASSTGSGRWLPAVAALPGLQHREVRAQSQGKATITDLSGGTAEIDLKLGQHHARPAPAPAPKISAAPPVEEPVLLIALETPAVLVQDAGNEGSYPALNVELGQAGDVLLGGVQGLVKDIIGFGSRFVAQLPEKIEPAPAQEDTAVTYLDLNLKLNNVDVAQLVKSLGVKLDFPVAGKVSFQVKASIPTNRAGDLRTYKATGSAQASDLLFAGVRLASLSADVNYAGGVLTLRSLKGRFTASAAGADPAAGTIAGSGKLQVAPLGDLSAKLTLDRIPVSAVAGLAAGKMPVDGTFSGQLAVRGPAAKLKNLDAIEGDGKVTSERLSAYGLALEQVSTSISLKGGVVRLPDLAGKLDGTPIGAAGELRLAGAYPFQAHLDLKNWDLASLMKLAAKGNDKEPPVLLAGSFTTTVDVGGTLSPFKADLAGDASTAGLKINAFQVADVKFHWTTDGAKLDLSKVDLHLYGGEATGSAVLPLQADAAGTVDLKLTGLDAKQLVKDLALPVKIEGKVDGTIKGTLPPAAKGAARTAVMDLDVSAPKLRVQNIPTEQLRGKLDYKSGVVDYKLEGKSLGGTFELEGQIPSAQPVKKESKKGRLRIENVALSRLVEALNLQDAVPITGRLSVELDYTHDTPGREPNGTGRLRIANLRWKDTALATSLQGELVLANGQLRMRELSGEIARGTARLGAVYDLHRPEGSRFTLVLENVEASELLDPFIGEKIKGTLQARIRGAVGENWHGTANVELTRGEVFGMEVANWRVPIQWQYGPATGRVQVEVYETSAQVARGRVTGKVTATWDYTWRIDGNVRCYGVDLQTLIRPFAGNTQTVAGQVTGRFDFGGNEVRSISDLNGNLVASFNQAQPLQIPGISALTPYLGMGPSTTFQRGELKARLDRGVLRVQKLALEGGNLQLYADGTVSLASGGLDLTVVAKNGDVGLPTVRLGVLGLRIPIAGPLPLTLLQEASALLSNRVVYLAVTGTMRHPVVRVRPLALLSEEAVRFFLNRANLPIPLAP